MYNDDDDDLKPCYLQLAMAQGNLKRTTFRVVSSTLYEFTPMPFESRLTSAG